MEQGRSGNLIIMKDISLSEWSEDGEENDLAGRVKQRRRMKINVLKEVKTTIVEGDESYAKREDQRLPGVAGVDEDYQDPEANEVQVGD